LLDTVHRRHSADNVDFGPNDNAKVIAIRTIRPAPPGVLAGFDSAQSHARPGGLFVALVIAVRADA
jgi:hypothetical protein